ncbi:MAG: tol-pal system YbgF family protein [Bdellovibrionales bacterium]
MNDHKERKLDKQEVKKPDAFLTLANEFIRIITKYRGPVMAGIAVVLLGSVAIGVYIFYQESVEQKAQDALFAARKKLRPELSAPLGQQPTITAKTLNEDSIQQLDSVMNQYPKSRAAIVAAIELSQAYLEENKSTEAVGAIKKVTPSLNSRDVLYGMYQYQLGKALSSAGQCPEALAPLNALANSSGAATIFKSGALLQTGLCYEAMKQPEKAIEVYERITKEYTEGASSESAKKYLRLLKRNSKS